MSQTPAPTPAAAPATPVPSTPAPSTLEMLQGRGTSRKGLWFTVACWTATWSSVAILAFLLLAILFQAWGWLDWQFLVSHDSATAEKAGVLSALWGSFWTILLTILFAVPVGIGAAIYLQEYASDSWMTRLIRINIANLAGVPSIVYGILGLTVFVRMFGIFAKEGWLAHKFGHQVLGISILGFDIPLPFGESVVAGALTMSLLILPMIIVASQEALKAVPASLRHASYALGASQWQTIWNQVLPASLPGILTGIILAISRAVGETAPLILVGAAAYVPFAPANIESPLDMVKDPGKLTEVPFSKFTVLPIQIFVWVRETGTKFPHVAAAGIVVLMIGLLLLNGIAILIRNRFQKYARW